MVMVGRICCARAIAIARRDDGAAAQESIHRRRRRRRPTRSCPARRRPTRGRAAATPWRARARRGARRGIEAAEFAQRRLERRGTLARLGADADLEDLHVANQPRRAEAGAGERRVGLAGQLLHPLRRDRAEERGDQVAAFVGLGAVLHGRAADDQLHRLGGLLGIGDDRDARAGDHRDRRLGAGPLGNRVLAARRSGGRISASIESTG